MKKLSALSVAIFFMLALSAAAFAGMGKSATVKGWVSDSVCGTKGANASAEACTKKCLEKGAKIVIVTDGDQKVLMVDNPDALKDARGTPRSRDRHRERRFHSRGQRQNDMRKLEVRRTA